MLTIQNTQRGALAVADTALASATALPLTVAPERVTQASLPNASVFDTIGLADRGYIYLPYAAIGGNPAPGNVNGFSEGPVGLWRSTHDSTEDYAGPLPAIYNPPQGNVGRTNFATRQYLGVIDQMAQYPDASLFSAAASVGVPVRTPDNG